ncbi:chymotrypsin-1 isoform X2 [Tribolium castaneum]|uniref:chymotrypsin-1 isoform X2 n=1 Tax=Tribolium castaneum TaxID=7070 RepID=UPI00077DD180|nr:PREDICTED: chymotrypsin-1-like isoform X2 [Tribolium castaneum]|eukprot:XP_015833141.1 PREDICTED: chymotrypsin-1-like isoform X2 [Tribolium castaneum]
MVVLGKNLIEKSVPEARIVGGSYAQNHKYQFIVSIRYGFKEQHGCGGTILGPNVVLTAAHCLYLRDPISVRYGSNNLLENNVRNVIIYGIYHHDYNPKTFRNDIAVLHLRDTIKFCESVKPVVLGKLKSLHQPVEVVGWGSVNPKDPISISNELKVVEMRALYPRNCKKQMAKKYKSLIFSTHICTRGTRGRGDCQGDSGGPLLDKNENQIGIVSWGVSCANKSPNIYTNVEPYFTWLKDKTKINLNIDNK